MKNYVFESLDDYMKNNKLNKNNNEEKNDFLSESDKQNIKKLSQDEIYDIINEYVDKIENKVEHNIEVKK